MPAYKIFEINNSAGITIDTYEVELLDLDDNSTVVYTDADTELRVEPGVVHLEAPLFGGNNVSGVFRIRYTIPAGPCENEIPFQADSSFCQDCVLNVGEGYLVDENNTNFIIVQDNSGVEECLIIIE